MAQAYTKAQIDEIAAIIGARIKSVGTPSRAPHFVGPWLGAGAYVSCAVTAVTPATIPSAANRIDFAPFIPSRTIVIDQLSVEVTTTIAASQARVGIYESNANGTPGALLTGQGALLDCAAAGGKPSAVAPSVVLSAGVLYWLAIHSSATQTYRGIAVAGLLPIGQGQNSGTVVETLRRATVTFASGLPANAPATTLTSAIMPRIALRLA